MGGHLFIYGPFALNGVLIPDSNKNFDENLKGRSEGRWGIRDAAWVADLADEHGLELTAMTAMPANNFFVVLTKVGSLSHGCLLCAYSRRGRGPYSYRCRRCGTSPVLFSTTVPDNVFAFEEQGSPSWTLGLSVCSWLNQQLLWRLIDATFPAFLALHLALSPFEYGLRTIASQNIVMENKVREPAPTGDVTSDDTRASRVAERVSSIVMPAREALVARLAAN